MPPTLIKPSRLRTLTWMFVLVIAITSSLSKFPQCWGNFECQNHCCFSVASEILALEVNALQIDVAANALVSESHRGDIADIAGFQADASLEVSDGNIANRCDGKSCQCRHDRLPIAFRVQRLPEADELQTFDIGLPSPVLSGMSQCQLTRRGTHQRPQMTALNRCILLSRFTL
ncbi:hypothetical protein Pla22_35630 [Rubripirellula amarantea]|uniref:Uncharacterized protein n=1 Tax=Rubripirellula amarantea TaxID=2527999 RepID=A0A5C5WJJ3_9BACT|nr:hypothetical protein Pla22_35630 [Rubripirellula amarantea]